jgi:dipeptidyl aminopeptidase/acylaminoacyl peptidase
MRLPALVAHAILILPLTCALLPVHAAGGSRPITAQDLWAVKRLGPPALSPNGQRAVYSVQEWSIEKNSSTASLWLTDVNSGATRRLTSQQVSDGSPDWSEDGKRIAFVSRRGDDQASALYVIHVDGGEAEKILELPYGIREPKWLPGDQGVVFATQVIPALAGNLGEADWAAMKKEAKRRKESKMTAYVTELRQFRLFDKNLTDGLADRLLKVNVATRAVQDLLPGHDRPFNFNGEAQFSVAPDGRHVAIVLNSTLPPYSGHPNPDIYLVPTDGSGKLRNLTPDNPRIDAAPHFSPDGKAVLFTRQQLPTIAGELQRLWRHELSNGRNTPLTAGLDLSIDDIAFSSDGRKLWLQAEQQGRVPLFAMRADGSGFEPVFSEGSNTELDSTGGRLVFLHETSMRAAELYVLDAGNRKPRRSRLLPRWLSYWRGRAPAGNSSVTGPVEPGTIRR